MQNKMSQEMPKYCEHFEYLKTSESISIDKEAACKHCFQTQQLWMCLAKHCNTYVCAKNQQQHLQSHLEESRKNKKFHSIFINPNTAEIICIQCHIEIGDLDIPSNVHLKNKNDPFTLRTKLLPGLHDLVTHKIVGQLQNSQGHKKISRGLVGLFANKYNYSINTAIQFLAHCQLFKQILLQLKVPEHNKPLKLLRQVIVDIDQANYRAIHTNTISQLLFKQFPNLLGYKRKCPFEIILYFLSLINQETLSYSLLSNHHFQEIDEWDLFFKKNVLRPNHLIYSTIESTLCLNYHCKKCNKRLSLPHNIQFLKLNIPKKKRKTKQVEKELASHRQSSPLKNRRKSLMNFFKQQQCPISVPQLIIELMKSPIHKEMNCDQCNQPLKKTKLHFQRLPDILIIQIARMGKDGASLDQTLVELSIQSLDMGPFTEKPEEEVMYDFESAICIEKGCLFPVIVIGHFNKQKYIIRNQIVQLCKEKMNPYILCYKRRPSASAVQKLIQIKDDLNSDREKKYALPDFWYLQLENSIERPFKNQLVCKHNFLRPDTSSKMIENIKVSAFVYEDLHHFYLNFGQECNQSKRKSIESSGSPKTYYPEEKVGIYNDEICELCVQELEQLNLRRKKQRQLVLGLDKLKGNSIPFCMISASWVKRWSNFLYNKETFAYMPKGHPLPLSIDNKVLLDGSKCKANLVKNQDFKVLNIYLWKFLKELYGGGPQIRYKWKQGRQSLDEQMLMDIKMKVSDLKMIYCSNTLESPKKLMTSISFIERSSFMEEVNESFRKPQHMMIQELEEDQP